jgi:flagellar hook-associated protein 3 FlgL
MARVPDALMYNKGQLSLDRARNTMIRNQEKALTGKMVNRPSDDPVAAMKISQLNSTMKRDETVSSNLDVAQNFLTLTDSALGELSDVLSRAKELAIQMSSTTNQTEDARLSVAQEVDQLMLRCVQIGNSRLGDRYIFGGFQTDRPPFDVDGNYFGDAGLFEVEMDRGQKIGVNVPGMIPFYGVDEVSADGQAIREQSSKDGLPTIAGTLRNPASIEAERLGIDPEDDPEEFKAIERKNGVNLFLEIKKFADGLKSDDSTLVNVAIDSLDRGFQQVIAARSMIGAKENIIRISQDSLESQKVNNADLKSQSEDADTLKIYSDLAKNENVLKSSIEINRKLLTPSLLDFLK